MVYSSTDQDRVKKLLTEAVTLLCRSSLNFSEKVSVEGLLGITLDEKDIFLVSIHETIQQSLQAALATAEEAAEESEEETTDTRAKKTRRRRRGRRRKSQSSESSESETESSSPTKRVRVSEQVSDGEEHSKLGADADDNSYDANVKTEHGQSTSTPRRNHSSASDSFPLDPAKVKQELSDADDCLVVGDIESGQAAESLWQQSADYDPDSSGAMPENLFAHQSFSQNTSLSSTQSQEPNFHLMQQGKDFGSKGWTLRGRHNCTLCNYSSRRAYNLRRHTITVHDNQTVNYNQKNYMCPCNRTFASKQSLDSHLAVCNIYHSFKGADISRARANPAPFQRKKQAPTHRDDRTTTGGVVVDPNAYPVGMVGPDPSLLAPSGVGVGSISLLSASDSETDDSSRSPTGVVVSQIVQHNVQQLLQPLITQDANSVNMPFVPLQAYLRKDNQLIEARVINNASTPQVVQPAAPQVQTPRPIAPKGSSQRGRVYPPPPPRKPAPKVRKPIIIPQATRRIAPKPDPPVAVQATPQPVSEPALQSTSEAVRESDLQSDPLAVHDLTIKAEDMVKHEMDNGNSSNPDAEK